MRYRIQCYHGPKCSAGDEWHDTLWGTNEDYSKETELESMIAGLAEARKLFPTEKYRLIIIMDA